MENLTNPDSYVSVEQLNYYRGKLNIYEDVYIGVGDTHSVVMVAANHHESVEKGTPVSVSASNKYLWIILPSKYTPLITMSGIPVPVTAQSDITEEGVTYKVLKSDNRYTGTFSITIL